MTTLKAKRTLGQQAGRVTLLSLCFGIPLFAAVYFRPLLINNERERQDTALALAFHSVFGDFDNQPWYEPVWSNGVTLYKIKKINAATGQKEITGYAALLSSSAADAGIILTGWDREGAWLGKQSFQGLPMLKPEPVRESFEQIQETVLLDRVSGERERSET